MPWIDAHLDLAYLAVGGRDIRNEADASIGCISLPALRAADVNLVFATIYTSPRYSDNDQVDPWTYSAGDAELAHRAGVAQLDVYRALEDEGELSIVRSALDLETRTSLPKIVILMEGADPIRSSDAIDWWRERGLRMVGLTWSAGTRYASGNAQTGGLTKAGHELVAALDEHGIVHDVSHLSDGAFDELVGSARGSIVATHSNCRALLSENQRHLRDDQIRVIGRRDGVIGLNLYSNFLAHKAHATINDCIAHVNQVAQIMGHRRGIGLGSDMDGGFGPGALPVGLDHPGKLDRLSEAMCDAGWTDADVKSFQRENWMALLRRALPNG